MMRIGIIGAGAIAFDTGGLGLPMTHVRSCETLRDRVSLVAFAEPDDEQRARVASLYPHLVAYPSASAMIEEQELDIVSLCTPDSSHEAMLLDLLDRPIKGIWCEKPLAMSVEGGLRIVEKARSAGIAVQVNYWRRFIPEVQALAAAVRQGEYGPLLRVSGIYADTWIHNGCHLYDLMELIVGEFVPKRVWDGTNGADCVTIVGQCGDAEAVCVGIPRQPYNVFELDMFFANGRVRIAENGRRIEFQPHGRDDAFPHLCLLRAEPETTICRWRESFDNALADLAECIQEGREPLSGPVRSLACARTLETASFLLANERETITNLEK